MTLPSLLRIISHRNGQANISDSYWSSECTTHEGQSLKPSVHNITDRQASWDSQAHFGTSCFTTARSLKTLLECTYADQHVDVPYCSTQHQNCTHSGTSSCNASHNNSHLEIHVTTTALPVAGLPKTLEECLSGCCCSTSHQPPTASIHTRRAFAVSSWKCKD